MQIHWLNYYKWKVHFIHNHYVIYTWMAALTQNIDVYFLAIASNSILNETFIATGISEINNLKHQCWCILIDVYYTVFIFGQWLTVFLPCELQWLKIISDSIITCNGDRRLKVKYIGVITVVRLTAITAPHQQASYGKVFKKMILVTHCTCDKL